MPEGRIIRALSGFYYVEADGVIWECKARGIFKKKNLSPLVGDYVVFDATDEKKGYITELKPRKNELHRPPICNVDQVILVFSIKEPSYNANLLDKFIIHVENADIEPIICLTKLDLANDETKIFEKVANIYRSIGYRVLETSKYGIGKEELTEVLKGKISVFAGQSGVGKSSLLNTILPTLELETAPISQKLGRGKHTTRVVQLIDLPDGGKVADTPGFGQLDFQNIESADLSSLFIEFQAYTEQCRFRGCMHVNEPGCAVKAAVSENKITAERYKHYVEFLQEIREKEENKWR